MTIKERERLDRAKTEAYKFFVDKGYTPAQAAGIVGNLIQESNLKTFVESFDGTGSVGIAQWNPKGGPRLDNLKSFAEEKGTDWKDFNTQLEFIDYELQNTRFFGLDKLRQATTPEEAALVFSRYYERPHKDYAHNDKRVKYANDLYAQFTDANIYTKDNSGNIKAVNPEYASDMDIILSNRYKSELYNNKFLMTAGEEVVYQPEGKDPDYTEKEKQAEEDLVETQQSKDSIKNFISQLREKANQGTPTPQYQAIQPSVTPTEEVSMYTPPEQLIPQQNEFFSFWLDS